MGFYLWRRDVSNWNKLWSKDKVCPLSPTTDWAMQSAVRVIRVFKCLQSVISRTSNSRTTYWCSGMTRRLLKQPLELTNTHRKLVLRSIPPKPKCSLYQKVMQIEPCYYQLSQILNTSVPPLCQTDKPYRTSNNTLRWPERCSHTSRILSDEKRSSSNPDSGSLMR